MTTIIRLLLSPVGKWLDWEYARWLKLLGDDDE